MTEDKFSELVNLYLDKEISAEDLASLKAELAANSEREIEFRERCRLHQAMRLAMVGTSSGSSSTRRRSGVSTRRKRSGSSKSSSRSQASKHSSAVATKKRSVSQSSRGARKAVDRPVESAASFPRWIPAVGLAACLAIGGMMLYPVFTDTTHISKQTLEGVSEDELEQVKDPLATVDRSDLKRFASNYGRSAPRSSSLAAELRLLGLHPEVMDHDAELSEISMASIKPRDVSQRRIEMFNQLKEYSPLPRANILETAEPKPSRSSHWPAGFQTSLATFK